VVAVDATRVCVEENPKITGAHADPEKIGVTAAELLLKRSDTGDESLYGCAASVAFDSSRNFSEAPTGA
jgi:hypothetical protein